MPPVANPNPDRARRGASVVSTIEAKDEVVAEPLLPVGAPAAAPIVPAASVAARPYMHFSKTKLRNLVALQPAKPTDPTGYPAADWRAF